MPFSATLRYPEAFSRIIDCFSKLVDVITFDVDPEGMSTVTVDGAHVFLIELVLHATQAFTKYSCGAHSQLSIKLEPLSNIFKQVDRNDIVTIGIKGEDPDEKLFIEISSIRNGVSTMNKFILAQMMVMNEDRIEIPDRTYPAEMMLPANQLVEICNQMKGVGERLRISIKDDMALFQASSEIVEAAVSIRTQGSVVIVCSNPDSQMFKFEYFHKMAKACKIQQAKEVLLQMGPSQPLSLCYVLEGMGTFNFYLAPMLEE